MRKLWKLRSALILSSLARTRLPLRRRLHDGANARRARARGACAPRPKRERPPKRRELAARAARRCRTPRSLSRRRRPVAASTSLRKTSRRRRRRLLRRSRPAKRPRVADEAQKSTRGQAQGGIAPRVQRRQIPGPPEEPGRHDGRADARGRDPRVRWHQRRQLRGGLPEGELVARRAHRQGRPRRRPAHRAEDGAAQRRRRPGPDGRARQR